MKKTFKKLLGFTLAFAMILGCFALPSKEAQAAKPYTTKKISHNQTITGKKCTIKVECYYEYVQFKGTKKAVKKINKALKPKNYEDYKSSAIASAKDAADEWDYDDTYMDYTAQTVSYYNTKKNITSIYELSVWYAGGVQNTFESGRTFNLKTGKEIKKITDVTKEKSLAKLKKNLKKAIEKKDEGYDTSEIDKMKATDFHFYITKKGKVCICFGPYELGFGGWSKKFYFEGDNLI